MGKIDDANTAHKAIQKTINDKIQAAETLSKNSDFQGAVDALKEAKNAYTTGFEPAELLRRASSRKATDAKFSAATSIAQTTTELHNGLDSLINAYQLQIPPALPSAEEVEKARLAAVETARLAAVEKARLAAVETARLAAVEKARLAAVETARLAAVETARLAAVETARLAAVETARLAAAEIARLAEEERKNTPEYIEEQQRLAEEKLKEEEEAAAAEAIRVLEESYITELTILTSIEPNTAIQGHFEALLKQIPKLHAKKELTKELVEAMQATTSLLHKNPAEKADFDAYMKVANKMQGHPSVGLNVLGGLMVVLAIAAAALAAAGLGLIILATAAVVSAGAAAGAGISFFSARRQSISKDMADISQDLQSQQRAGM